MRLRHKTASALMLAMLALGCGAVYQAGTRIRAHRMSEALQPGQSAIQIHDRWGEPDIRRNQDSRTEVWSYADHPNSNDMVAALLYTAPKESDAGLFLDLVFVDGKLTTWHQAEHTMPPKQPGKFGYSIGVPGGNSSHY